MPYSGADEAVAGVDVRRQGKLGTAEQGDDCCGAQCGVIMDEVLDLAHAAQHPVTTGAGDVIGVLFDQRNVECGIVNAQVLGAGGTTESTADNHDARRRFGGLRHARRLEGRHRFAAGESQN